MELKLDTVEIKIKKITCSGCAGRIYRALSQYPGIIKSSVDYKNNSVTVIFNKLKINETKIKETIDFIGFEVI